MKLRAFNLKPDMPDTIPVISQLVVGYKLRNIAFVKAADGNDYFQIAVEIPDDISKEIEDGITTPLGKTPPPVVPERIRVL